MSDYLPKRAVTLARISDARNGDDHGVQDQIKRERVYADRLGWTIGPDHTHVIIENDTSAYLRRKVCRSCLQLARDCTCPPLPDGSKRETVLRTWRPGFRRVLQMLKSGEADGLIALDLDRACRDPRDLEDLIDAVESRRPRIPVESVSGSLRLANDADITTARIMVTVANKSSRDTARRVAARRETKAKEGEYGGGLRPYGWGAPTGELSKDGKPVLDMLKLVEAEAAEVRRWADQVLAGVSLRSITADLRARGVPTVKGGEWETGTVRDVLLRPRNAGLMVYRVREAVRELRERGEPVPYDVGVQTGVVAAWEPIMPEETWRAVAALLTNPARTTTPGNTPKWLGSLIYRCGVCAARGVEETATVSGPRNHGHGPSYTCRSRAQGHLRRSARQVDSYVEEVVVRRLSLPDAADLVAPRPRQPDKAALYREQNTLRERKAELARLVADGTFNASDARDASKPLNDRLTEIEAQLTQSAQRSPLDSLPLGTDQVAAMWKRLPLGSQRAILRTLMDVRLDKGRPGRMPDGSYFDPDTVVITWRQ